MTAGAGNGAALRLRQLSKAFGATKAVDIGALDKKLREQMQVEIKRIHRSVGTTVIYVTHDQSEALTMSDLVVVMHQARVAQVGTPRALYEAPANLFVADFLGDSNLLPAKIVSSSGDETVAAIGNGATLRAPRD